MKNRKQSLPGFSRRFRRIAGTLLPALSAAFLLSCNDPKLAGDAEASDSSVDSSEGAGGSHPAKQAADQTATKTIPAAIIVENTAGKSFPGTLLAKRGDEIVVRRAGDEKLFLLAMDTLSSASRGEIGAFPDAEEEKLQQFKDSVSGDAVAAATARTSSRPPLGASFPDDFEAALARAQDSGKQIMVVFLGDNEAPPDDCETGTSGSSGST